MDADADSHARPRRASQSDHQSSATAGALQVGAFTTTTSASASAAGQVPHGMATRPGRRLAPSPCPPLRPNALTALSLMEGSADSARRRHTRAANPVAVDCVSAAPDDALAQHKALPASPRPTTRHERVALVLLLSSVALLSVLFTLARFFPSIEEEAELALPRAPPYTRAQTASSLPPLRREFDMTNDVTGELVQLPHSVQAVLVEHHSALQRLHLTEAERACIATTTCADLRVQETALPSWTLRVVDPACADCLDVGSYAAALNSTRLQGRQHGVFATSAAPLGRIGPMLLAMASVTDDVDVRAELPRWTWLRSVYGESFPRVPAAAGEAGDAATAGAPGATQGPPAPSYLAVMGIPSTDQPQRVALRDAQRATWLSYREVARTANDFSGALLPLYLFAAVEPDASATVSRVDDTLTLEPNGAAPGNNSAVLLLPTVREYETATRKALAAAATARTGGGASARADGQQATPRRHRRLRAQWAATGHMTSPCEGGAVPSRSAAGALVSVAAAMHLPLAPTFTVPARFVCDASAALWTEALTHRNVMWVDLGTDRHVRTKPRRSGDVSMGGLPLEVGLTQKLILWMNYAYHAFPNVPYIMKGDDDTYVKVPQYLSDLRRLSSGELQRRGGNASDAMANASSALLPSPTAAPSQRPASSATVLTATTAADAAATATPLCLYWGSGRRRSGIHYAAPMLYLLHRRLVHTLLDPTAVVLGASAQTDEVDDGVDLAALAAVDFSYAYKALYRRSGFRQTAAMIGAVLLRRRDAVVQRCPHKAVWYVVEARTRLHDVHVASQTPVSWATIAAHRCRPADMHLLHHFFASELAAATRAVARGDDREAMAVESAAAWADATRRALPGNVTGWDDLAALAWTHNNIADAPPHVVDAADGVAVYAYPFVAWRDVRGGVRDGLRTLALDGATPPGKGGRGVDAVAR